MYFAAGSRIRHADVPRHLDAVSHEPATPTSSVAAVTYGLRDDIILRRHRHQHRRRSSSPAIVQPAAAPPHPPPPRAHVAAVPPVFEPSWEGSSSDLHRSPKVITVVDGTGVPRPRPNVKFLLNQQTLQTYAQFVRDVACALEKGTRSTVMDDQPAMRLFTVRGREVADISDLYRDDDVFIGVGVGREELSVVEVRQIFQELYPNSEYSEVLVRKWMRTRRRNVRPRHAERTKRTVVSDVTTKPDETIVTVRRDGELDRTVQEVENAVEVENASLESKLAGETADGRRLDDVKTLENSESRLQDSELNLSQHLARITRVYQKKQVGSEPRRRKPPLPPLASTSSQQVHDRDVNSSDRLPRSRPRPLGRRQLRLPPLQDSLKTDAEPARKSKPKLRLDINAALENTVRETTPRHHEKDLDCSPAPNDHSVRTSKEPSTPGKQSAIDSQRDKVSSAIKTDENFNIITEVPHLGDDVENNTARSKETARSEVNGKSVDVVETSTSKMSSRSEKDKKRARSNHVRMKTKFERQVSTVEHVTSCYEEGNMLGDGNFAVVKQCRHRETGREYAMKIIDKSKMANKEDMIENEIAIMLQCNHVNIVRLYEEYETKHEIYLITELVKVHDHPRHRM